MKNFLKNEQKIKHFRLKRASPHYEARGFQLIALQYCFETNRDERNNFKLFFLV